MQYQLDGWPGEVVARHRPDLAFGVAPLPVRQAGDPPLTWSGGYSYVMARQAQHPELSWDLIKWLVSEAGWTAAGENVGAYLKSLWYGHAGFNVDWGEQNQIDVFVGVWHAKPCDPVPCKIRLV